MSAPHQGQGTVRFMNLVLPGTKIIFTLQAPSTYKAADVVQVLYDLGWTTTNITGASPRFNATTRRSGGTIAMPTVIGIMRVLSAVRA
jgi:hypothetical protein